MLLYHFTAAEYLEWISVEGLTRGDVPVSPDAYGVNAVWLTRSANPHGHGLSEGGTVALSRHAAMELGASPVEAGGTFRTLNKKAVRLTAKISSSDRLLHYWPKWAKKRVEKEWYAALDLSGGGGSDTWYLYFGVISPSMITEAVETKTGRRFELSDPTSWPDRLSPEIWKA